MAIPNYLSYFVFAGTAATLVAILYGLNRALANAAWPVPSRVQAVRVAAAILVGWLAVAANWLRWASTMWMPARFPRSNTASCCPF